MEFTKGWSIVLMSYIMGQTLGENAILTIVKAVYREFMLKLPGCQ